MTNEDKDLAPVTLTKDQPKLPLKQLIDMAYEYREQIRELNSQKSDLEEKLNLAQEAIIEQMNDIGTDRAGGDRANVFLTSEEFAVVEDWEAFGNYIVDNEAVYLLQRRLNQKPMADLRAGGIAVPGTGVIPKAKLAIRKK